MQATSRRPRHTREGCLAREILDRIGDKWSVYVIDALAAGTRRFSELRREVDGVSQRV